MQPDALNAIVLAIISTLGLTQAGKKILERLIEQGSSKMPPWVKQYVLPIVGAVVAALMTGSTDAISQLPTAGITVPVMVGLLTSLAYRTIKGKPSEG